MSVPAQSEAHAKLRESKGFQDELKFLQRTRDSFIKAFTAITLYSSRSPYLCRKSLLFTDAEDILQSVQSYAALVPEGILNVTRRELRYILETVCTHYYVDSQQFDRPLEKRVAFLRSLGRQPKIELLANVKFEAFDTTQSVDFINDVSQLYSLLCEFDLGGKLLKSWTTADLNRLGAEVSPSFYGGERAVFQVLGCEQVPRTNEYIFSIKIAKDKKVSFDILTGDLQHQ